MCCNQRHLVSGFDAIVVEIVIAVLSSLAATLARERSGNRSATFLRVSPQSLDDVWHKSLLH